MNWDLKRDVKDKMTELERRTKEALLKLAKKIQEEEEAEEEDDDDDAEVETKS